MSDKEDESEAIPSIESEPPGRLPRINLVDINKLLDPNAKPLILGSPTPCKGRKSVTFDSSVIVLSSSDEDTPKKDPGGKNSLALKSVLRNSAYKKVESSSSGTKKKARASRKKVQSSSSSSEASISLDSDSDSDFRPSSRQLRNKRATKAKFTKLVDDRASRRLRRKPIKVSSSSESEAEQELELDQKFKCKITIDLPKIKCEEMKKMWRSRRDVFEAKWLEKRKRQKRAAVGVESSDSDDVPLVLKARGRKEVDKAVVEIVDSDSEEPERDNNSKKSDAARKLEDETSKLSHAVPDRKEKTGNSKTSKKMLQSDDSDSEEPKKESDPNTAKTPKNMLESDHSDSEDVKEKKYHTRKAKTSKKSSQSDDSDSDGSNRKKKTSRKMLESNSDSEDFKEKKYPSRKAKSTKKSSRDHSDSEDKEKKYPTRKAKTSKKYSQSGDSDSEGSDRKKTMSKKMLESNSDSEDFKEKKYPTKKAKTTKKSSDSGDSDSEDLKEKECSSRKAKTTKKSSDSGDSDSEDLEEKKNPKKAETSISSESEESTNNKTIQQSSESDKIEDSAVKKTPKTAEINEKSPENDKSNSDDPAKDIDNNKIDLLQVKVAIIPIKLPDTDDGAKQSDNVENTENTRHCETLDQTKNAEQIEEAQNSEDTAEEAVTSSENPEETETPQKAVVTEDKKDEKDENKTCVLAEDSDHSDFGNSAKKKATKTSESEDSDIGPSTKQKATKTTRKRSESDDSDLLGKPQKKKSKANSPIELSDSDESDNEKKDQKKTKKKNIISDSDSDAKHSDKNIDEDDSEEEEEVIKPARKRIKRVKDSSDEEEEDKTTRKKIRHMIDRDSLQETTKQAEQEEKERKSRIMEKQKKYNQIFELKADATVDKVVLDFDETTQKPLLKVHKHLVKQLKPHQVHGVKFMWDACFESLQRAKDTAGSGCILAHCMGLGKTLQVIALAHTLLMNSEKTKVEKIMVVCPLNTVINWKNEFKKWMPDEDDFEVYELVSCKTTAINQERNYVVKLWHDNGGVLIVGYNMFRNLSNPDNKAISKKLRSSFQTALVDPGPDLVVCDEGHLLKNEKTNLSIAMNRIKTARRIVLTGTPLQNNLREYWCMVQFIKPNLLGTYKEYLNRFVNPIINGQYTDSTQHDIQVMRRRSHVLHKLLDGVVQRQDYAVLEPYLPPKYEYVLFIKLTEIQRKLYQHYMVNFARRSNGSNSTSFLFTDFQEFQRISIHPRVLMEKSIKDFEKKEQDDSESEGSIKDFIDDDSESAESTGGSSSSGSGSNSDASVKSSPGKKSKKKASVKKQRLTRAQVAQRKELGVHSESEEEDAARKPSEWFDEFVDRNDMDKITLSAKLQLLFEILKECEDIGDKILVFSQSLYTLNCIEYFLAKIEEATQKGDTDAVGGYSGSWALGLDYFRLDGSSSCDNRANWCDQFNDPDNTRARLFLISTKAGGLGINLVAANRVIIFDVSWNPSHDIQSIYRVYRFGQTKPSYIYRFVTYGAMEMKIYERQVTKQAISKRVIDEQQIDRHYSQHDIMELYKSDLEPAERPIPMVPKDVLLGEMLQKHSELIYKFHEHQSLLENKHEEQLDEEERKAAWDEFENEKVLRRTTVSNFGPVNNQVGYSPALAQLALLNIVKRDNPSWSDIQIRGVVPALYKQMLMQISENDYTVFARVQKEVEMMQNLQAQRMIQQYHMQQVLQQQQNAILNNLSIGPEELRAIQQQAMQNFLPQHSGSSAPTNDVIELND